MLVPYSWFQILWYFYIYGFLGWCSEVAFAAVAHGKFVNRGFVNGPICSIYGFGVMSVLLVLGAAQEQLLAAVRRQRAVHERHRIPHRLGARESVPRQMVGLLQASAEHQGLCVPGVLGAVGHRVRVRGRCVPAARGQGRRSHPKKLGWVLLGTFSALWIADNIITAMEIRKLPKKLRALQAIEDSLTAISDEIGEEIYIRASDAKDRGMEVYSGVKEKGAEIAEKGAEIAEKRAESSVMRRSELLARRSELLQRREEILSHRNIVHERIAQAFPALRSGQTNGRAFTRVHEHAQRRKELTKAVKAKAKALKNKAKDRT